MDLSLYLKKGIKIETQQPGLPEDGPLSPCLKLMLARTENGSIRGGQLVSPVGADLARLFTHQRTRVVFMETAGSGITPWRGLIILDIKFIGKGQTKYPYRIALVAHELTHLLQREFNQRHYWPSGGLRPSFSRRWIGDSTNYMEVLSFLVGWTVEHDIIASRILSPEQTPEEHAKDVRRLATIRDNLATLSGLDPRNACRLVLKLFPEISVYQKNFEVDNRTSDGRIPSGSWHHWLRQMGFSRQAIDHIMILASQGHGEWIDDADVA